MMIKAFVVSLFLLLLNDSIHAQDMTVSDLNKKVLELEKRIVLLENIILEMNSGSVQAGSNKAVTNNSNWRRLKVGMNEIEVQRLLGEPTHVVRFSPSLYKWEYSNETWHSTITFDNKGVYSWEEPR